MGDRMFASEGDSVHAGRPPSSWEDRWNNSPPRGIDTGRAAGPHDVPAGDDTAVGIVRRMQSRVDRHRWLLERMQADPLQAEPAGLPELLDTVRRMRRDTESLLILQGQNPGVAPGTRTLSDVLAAAAAAAEEPGRVDVRGAPSATVSPAGATELLHVLAEVVDHVTAVYPGSRVDVSCRTEAPGGVAVEVRADSATRHDPEGLGGRRALLAAQRLAQRSLSGIVLRTSGAGVTASGPVASIHCPGSVVTVDPVPGREPERALTSWSTRRRPAAERPDQPRLDQPRPDQPRPDQPRPDQPRLDQPRLDQPRLDQRRPDQPRPDLQRPDAQRAGARRPAADPPAPDPLALDPLFSGPLPLDRLLAEPTRLEPTHLDPALSAPPQPRTNGNGSGNGHGRGNGNGGATRAPAPAAPSYVPSAGSGVDELFGPMLDLAHDPADDHGATPIFEAIASAWFREDEPERATGGAHRNGVQPSGVQPSGVQPDGLRPNGVGPNGTDSHGGGRHGGGTSGAATRTEAPRNWETPSDTEWRAAAERAARPEPEAQTPTGLPRRRPGNQLVPPRRGVPEPERAERVPDRVRDRLSTYQRGLRQGRHRAEPASDQGDPAAW